MIQGVWRVPYWIGSHLEANHSTHPCFKTLNMTEASTMSIQVFCYVLWVKTGITKSEVALTWILTCNMTDKTAGPKQTQKWWARSIGRSVASISILRLPFQSQWYAKGCSCDCKGWVKGLNKSRSPLRLWGCNSGMNKNSLLVWLQGISEER